MKNFTKLLMAVVLLATYSCVQDTTEDLTPGVSGAVNGSGEVKTLQAVLPTPTRTELGKKNDAGKYPVYWCKEDVLAVNGMPTTKITFVGVDGNADKSSVAVFDLPLGITIPYNIVYPYAGESVAVNAGSGLYPVVFQTNQMHTENSFMPGSAPMYAWSNGFDDVHMHHLSAVLCFSIKAKAGEVVNLKYVSVSTLGAEPIAGVFDVYCGSRDENDEKTGSLTAREGAISTVFYNFEGDNFELGDKEAVFYVVVPKGDYKKGFEVNFVATNGEVCARTFNATGETELRGGVVREFPLIEEFTADHKMFLISNDADMLEFAAAVNGGSFESQYSGGALLVADVDVTDKGLKTINGFTSLFEGRNYSIKGLTEPLFGENFVGTVSNVAVEGNIVEKSNGKVGLLARSLSVDGDKVGKLFNCAATGSIVYENADVTVSDKLDLINVGGAVGGVYGGEVSLTECDVDVNINVAGPSGNALYKPCVGGVVGYACASGENLPVVVNNTSAGTIIWDDQSKSSQVVPFIGGVAGYVTAGTFTDNVNTGVLEIREAMYDLDWGGVIGASTVSVERCENKGSLTINEQVTTANIGGVLGLLEVVEEEKVNDLLEVNDTDKPSIKDCENSGQILLNENFKILKSSNIGGVVAMASKGSKEVSNCHNSGAIEYKGSCAYSSVSATSGNASIRLGGVAGLAWSELVANCGNRASANISVTGAISGNGGMYDIVNSDMYSGIGAVIGSRLGLQSELNSTAAIKTVDCNNQGAVYYGYEYCSAAIINASACIGVFDSDEALRCSNSGDLLVEVTVAMVSSQPTATTSQVALCVSGVFGYIKTACDKIEECTNDGVVRVDNCSARTLFVSGIASQCKERVMMTRCVNGNAVMIGKDASVAFLYVGGIFASTTYLSGGVVYPYCENRGNVICEANLTTVLSSNGKVVGGEAHLGGIFGVSQNCNKENTNTAGIQNSGKVSFTGSAEKLYMGGYAGSYTESLHTVEFVNTKNGVVEFNGRVVTEACIGGYAGKGTLSGGGEIKTTNKGNVTANGIAPSIYASGGFGYLTSTANALISGLTNNGIVEAPALSETTEFPTTIYLGGVFGYANLGTPYLKAETVDKPTRAIADCSNTGEVHYYALATDGAYIGGIVGKATKAPIYNCNNEGKIVSTGNAGDLPNRLSESADKARNLEQLYDHDLAIGGIVGETDHNVLASTNTAAIDHTCVDNPLKYDEFGTTATSRFDIGGLVGRVYVDSSNTTTDAVVSLNGLTNETAGSVTINGFPYCTTNTSSLDWGSATALQSNDIDDLDRTSMRPHYRMNVAGIVGRLHDHSTKNVKVCLTGTTNKAAVTIPNANYARMVNIAGVLADVLVSHTALSNTHNTGRIALENVGHGTSLDTAVRHAAFCNNMGGLVANCCDFRMGKSTYSGSLIAKTLTYNNCSNSGDIEYNEVAVSIYQSAGGLLGQALHVLEGYNNWSNSNRLPVSNMTITMNNCENYGNIKFFTKMISGITKYDSRSYAGGMVGSCGNATSNGQSRFAAIDLLLTGCSNSGSIQFDRSNGSMSPNTSVDHSCVGGLVGFYHGGIGQVDVAQMKYNDHTVENGYRMEMNSCLNEGRVWGFSGHIGGLVGRAQWYVKIADSKNTGDIVVARNESAGGAVRRTGYGTKVIYAGGIAGSLLEYWTDSRFLASDTGTNEGWPAYPLGTQYVRVENCVNEGAVGATTQAGGIVGNYRSLYVVAVEGAGKSHRGGIEGCINTGDIYALEGATSQVGLIVGSKRLFTQAQYKSYQNDETDLVGSKSWPIGVKNCTVSGQVLRLANRYYTADGSNYMNLIYGENWDADEFTSIVKDKSYDGCTLVGEKTEEPLAARR